MKRAGDNRGFTIVETLIVLTVTAVLFVAISGNFSGRRHLTEYQTASTDARAKIQQVISEVRNGYFPDTASFTCSDAGSSSPLIFSSGAADQGRNKDCVFLGKIISFQDIDNPRILVVAGRTKATSLNDAALTTVKDLQDRMNLQADLTITKATLADGTIVKGVGFLLDFQASGRSGQQAVTTYGITNTNNITDGTNLVTRAPAGPVSLYLLSGGTDNCAKITMGAGGANLDADLTTVPRAECS